jgi:hypothetical protein
MSLEGRIKSLENNFPQKSELDIFFNSLTGPGDIDALPDDEVNRVYALGMEELGWVNIDAMTIEEIEERLRKIKR